MPDEGGLGWFALPIAVAAPAIAAIAGSPFWLVIAIGLAAVTAGFALSATPTRHRPTSRPPRNANSH
jgi:hypothetical protein